MGSLLLRSLTDISDHEERSGGELLLVDEPGSQLYARYSVLSDSWKVERALVETGPKRCRTYLLIILIWDIPLRQTCFALTILVYQLISSRVRMGQLTWTRMNLIMLKGYVKSKWRRGFTFVIPDGPCSICVSDLSFLRILLVMQFLCRYEIFAFTSWSLLWLMMHRYRHHHPSLPVVV
jgi:hypothetical protein